MSNNNVPAEIDPEDMFSDTRMSIGDHIEDLRAHLLRALAGLVIGMILGFWPLGPYVLNIINAPVEQELKAFDERKLERDIKKNRARLEAEGVLPKPKMGFVYMDRAALAAEFGLKDLPPVKPLEVAGLPPEYVKVPVVEPDPLKATEDALREQQKARYRGPTTLGITEMFFVYMKISFFTGLVLSSPWVFYHIWMFVAAGLYPNEKKLINVYLPFSVFLFIAGVLLCELFAMKRAVNAMLAFNEWLDVDADIRLNEWLSFAIMMPLVFGLAFQTPLVMMFIHKIGLVSVGNLRHYRRISWFALVIIAALLAPSPDPYSLLILWVPMVGLYELGILLCVWQGDQNRLLDFGGATEEEKAEEFVEV